MFRREARGLAERLFIFTTWEPATTRVTQQLLNLQYSTVLYAPDESASHVLN